MEEAGPSRQLPFVQFFFLYLSAQKQAWQPSPGRNPAPTLPGTGWGSPGRPDLSYLWTRGTYLMCPTLRSCSEGGSRELTAWSLPCPKCMSDQTLDLMGLLPAQRGFFLTLSLCRRTIDLLAHRRHLAVAGGPQGSRPTLSGNQGNRMPGLCGSPWWYV